MPLRFSDGLRNFLARHGSLAQALQGGSIRIFTGSQPASANDAQTGTLLVVLTKGAAALTHESLPAATITLTGGTSGSVDTVTLDGYNLLPAPVPYNSSLTQTAADVAAAINRTFRGIGVMAVSSGASFTVFAPRGSGTAFGGKTLAVTATSITTDSPQTMSAGTSGANGLSFDVASGGVLAKHPSEVWAGVAVATGTAGWFRFIGAGADGGGSDPNAIRLDGSVGTSGANLNMTSTSIAAGATQTVNTWQFTFPASGV